MGRAWLWVLMLLGARGEGHAADRARQGHRHASGKRGGKRRHRLANLTGLVFHSHSEGPKAQVPNDLLAWIPLVNHTAVVRPFWRGELLPLVEAEQQAFGCKIHACPAGAEYRLPVDLVLYYAGSRENTVHGQTAAAILDTLAGLLASRGCFRAVGVGFANMRRSVRYPEGPCEQF